MDWPIAACLAVLAGLNSAGAALGQGDPSKIEWGAFHGWARAALCGEPSPAGPAPVGLELRRQDHGELGRARNCIGDPLRIGEKRYEHGLGTHSVSELVVHLPQPAARLEAEIGIDNDRNTFGREGTVVFAVEVAGKELYRSGVRRGSDPPLPIRVELGGARQLVLRVLDAGDGPSCDHGDWAGAAVLQADGKRLYLDELPLVTSPARLDAAIPYSFVYGGKPSGDLLRAWKRTEKHQTLDDGRQRHTITHADPDTGLEVTCDLTLYADFPAAEWVLTLHNGGSRDTPILEKVRPLDLAGQLSATGKLVLHYANGSTASPTDYQPFDAPLGPEGDLVLAPSGGRSSNGRFPFFNLDWGDGGLAGAVGWSGQWQLRAGRDKDRRFHLQAGQQVTHFLLHPAESVRTPRILLVGWQGERLRGHNMLRRLIYRWHTPLLGTEKPLPPTQCNTWFPVGDNGGNANEQNQVELLGAYAGRKTGEALARRLRVTIDRAPGSALIRYRPVANK